MRVPRWRQDSEPESRLQCGGRPLAGAQTPQLPETDGTRFPKTPQHPQTSSSWLVSKWPGASPEFKVPHLPSSPSLLSPLSFFLRLLPCLLPLSLQPSTLAVRVPRDARGRGRCLHPALLPAAPGQRALPGTTARGRQLPVGGSWVCACSRPCALEKKTLGVKVIPDGVPAHLSPGTLLSRSRGPLPRCRPEPLPVAQPLGAQGSPRAKSDQASLAIPSGVSGDPQRLWNVKKSE